MNRITILLLVITLFSADSLAQNWGVGLRAGDPTGLTVKKYMGDNDPIDAIEISGSPMKVGQINWTASGLVFRYFDRVEDVM